MNIKGSTFDGSVFQKFDLEEFIKYLEEEK